MRFLKTAFWIIGGLGIVDLAWATPRNETQAWFVTLLLTLVSITMVLRAIEVWLPKSTRTHD